MEEIPSQRFAKVISILFCLGAVFVTYRPFQRGLGRRATFLEDGGQAAKGNPLRIANVKMQLQWATLMQQKPKLTPANVHSKDQKYLQNLTTSN